MLLFSIFGEPVTHSISPRLHNNAMHDLKINGCYVRQAIHEPSLLMPTFHAMHLNGANVTVPHKEVAFAQCDEIIGIAQKIGAVNTLVKEKNKVIGYNTDAEGFYKAIASFGKIQSALILGAGGTAKAIAMILQHYGITTHILNRSSSRLAFFNEKGFTCKSWEDFEVQPYELIINTTSAGLKDTEFPCPEPLLEALLSQASYAFDVIYNQQTPFLAKASHLGLTCKDGKEMLLHQAVLAFDHFFHQQYQQNIIEISMRKAFEY